MTKTQSPFIHACPIGCESDLVTTDIVLPEGPLRRCTHCGQLVSMCSEKEYYHSIENFDRSEGTTPVDRSSYKRLEKLTRKILTKAEVMLKIPHNDLSLLDVGCSSGAFISVAQAMGVTVTGIEPAEKSAKTAMEAGLNVHNGFLEEIKFPEESFHVITVFEVIEHLKDPIALMKESFRILHPGGLVIIRTGNAGSWTSRYMGGRWEYFRMAEHGGHISFFNPFSINQLAERSNFFVERIDTHSVRFYEKEDVSYIAYRTAKMVSELLNLPSSWFGQGHEFQAYLRKTES